jgi:PAS domain S-box-containing protein
MDLLRYSIIFVSAVSLSLAVVNLFFLPRDHRRRGVVALVLCCVSAAAFSFAEVALMSTPTIPEYGEIMRWAQIPLLGIFIGLPVFLRAHLNAGRAWLMWAIIGVRLLSAGINFLMPVNIYFGTITEIKRFTIFGETLMYATGTRNPWILIPELSLVLLFVLGVDVLLTVYRRGNTGLAFLFGGGVCLMSLAAMIVSVSLYWGLLEAPPFASLAMVFVLAGMYHQLKQGQTTAYELSRTEDELKKKDRDLSLSTTELQNIKIALDSSSIVNITNADGNVVFVNRKFCEISGFSEEELIGKPYRLTDYTVHSKTLLDDIWQTIQNGEVWRGEICNRAKDNSQFWVETTVVPFKDAAGKIYQYVAIHHDITKRNVAQEEAHILSARLMGAQEKERARLARELHDDLSQSLALLSIQLQSIGRGTNTSAEIKYQVAELTDQIQSLASDVHRISHELHPSKLTQLGLEAALRGFCREISAAKGMKVRFESFQVPRDLPNDVSLCLYRVAQEAVQNAVKHSGASIANLRLSTEDHHILLTISDNGAGFDTSPSAKKKESLGLISMDERVRASRGELSIDSVLGAGTKITARLPLGK